MGELERMARLICFDKPWAARKQVFAVRELKLLQIRVIASILQEFKMYIAHERRAGDNTRGFTNTCRSKSMHLSQEVARKADVGREQARRTHTIPSLSPFVENRGLWTAAKCLLDFGKESLLDGKETKSIWKVRQEQQVEYEQPLQPTPQATSQTSAPPLPPSHPANVLEAQAPAMQPPCAEEED